MDDFKFLFFIIGIIRDTVIVEESTLVELILEIAQAAWLDDDMDELLKPEIIEHVAVLRSYVSDESNKE